MTPRAFGGRHAPAHEVSWVFSVCFCSLGIWVRDGMHGERTGTLGQLGQLGQRHMLSLVRQPTPVLLLQRSEGSQICPGFAALPGVRHGGHAQ